MHEEPQEATDGSQKLWQELVEAPVNSRQC